MAHQLLLVQTVHQMTVHQGRAVHLGLLVLRVGTGLRAHSIGTKTVRFRLIRGIQAEEMRALQSDLVTEAVDPLRRSVEPMASRMMSHHLLQPLVQPLSRVRRRVSHLNSLQK